MNILFISSWFPYPTNNGSKLRIYNLLRGLAQYHEITLLSLADEVVDQRDVTKLQSLCRAIHVVPRKPFDPRSRRARLGFLTLTPRSLVDTYSTNLKLCIEKELSGNNYDLVIASEFGTGDYGRYFRGAKAIFEDPELGVLYEAFAQATSFLARVRHGLTWTKYRLYLTRLLRNFDACTVVSEQERYLLSQAIPAFQAIHVIPNCINLTEYQEVDSVIAQPNSLIFTGPFGYAANYDAMTWFLQEVFLRIRAQVPAARLTITGDHANLPLPQSDNVTMTGFVDDVRPLIAKAWISVVPLRIGGGTRLKILEAMALRTPVVATTKGAEGLDVQHGRHLLIADTPAAFTDAVVRLLEEPGLRQQLTDSAYQLVREKYDWATVLPRFLTLAEEVAAA